MTEESVKQRLDKYKIKTLKNLLLSYRIVYHAPEPFHFHCVDKNGHKFIRVEVDDFSEGIREQITEMRKEMPPHTFIQIHLFKKYNQMPNLIDI